MTTRAIQAYLLQTKIAVDVTKGRAEMKAVEGDFKKVGEQAVKTGKEMGAAFKGAEVGKKWGSEFGASAVSSITGSINSMGQTIGAVIGTAIVPGIGTAIGSTLGSGIDTALQKISGPIIQTITQGIELNKEIEKATVHFTAFGGSEQEAAKHLKELKELSIASGLDLRDLIQGSERLEEFAGKLGDTSTKLKAAAAASIVFGTGAEGFNAVANALGLMTEKGELSILMLRKLERSQGVAATRYLAQAFGYTEQKMSALIKAGKIRGEVAAQIIAESTIRDKGPRAAAIMQGTTFGAEARFGASVALRGQEGTVAGTKAYGDFYRQAFAVLQSPQAQQFVTYLDKTVGSVINLVEKGLKGGLNLVQGIGQGITGGGALQSLEGSFTTLGNTTDKLLKGIFEIQSPSERMARVIGEPLGEGIGVGALRGLKRFFETDLERAFLKILTSGDLKEKLAAAAAKYGVPADLLAAVMAQESRGNPRAVSPAGAKGLMQFMPGTASTYGIRGREFDPASSIDAGAHLLSDLLRQFGGSVPDALAHYNWSGRGKMPQETKDYVRLITGLLGGRGGAGAMPATGPAPGGTQPDRPGYRAEDVYPEIDRYRNQITKLNEKSAEIFETLQFYNKELGEAANTVRQQELRDEYAKNTELVAGLNRQLISFITARQNPATRYGGTTIYGETGGEMKLTRSILGLNPELPKLEDNITDVVGEVRDLSKSFGQATPAIQGARLALATLALGAVPIMKGVNDAADLALTAVDADALINKSAAEIRKAGQITLSMADQLMGTIQQVSGMIPGQQTVGKKRGFFSKLLGFAAPFLSLIPGVGPILGPILSTIAGAAGNILGGNYGAAVSSIAGGFQTNGVFRSSSLPEVGKGMVNLPFIGTPIGGHIGTPIGGHRAGGGPVRFGNAYRVGESGEEWFMPDQNGHIIPHGTQVGQTPSSGSALLDRIVAALDRQTAALSRLEAVPPGHIVRQGIEQERGIIGRSLKKDMDSNSSLIEHIGRRLRLA